MKTFGLIGYPLSHSFSKEYFNQKFRSENINARYVNCPLASVDDVRELLNSRHIAGFNVTLPYKQKIIPFLDELSREAAEIGAVNVIKVIHHAGKQILKGFNSDVTGFSLSLKPLLQPHHRRALVLGTGGASRAVSFSLSRMAIEHRFVSQRPEASMFSYADLSPRIMNEYTLIVNTTPLGMYPETGTAPAIPYQHLTSAHLAFDLIYNPDVTLFLQKASQQGSVVKNGKEMLILQAEKAWRIWNSDADV
ncbi:MAG: shikimate dehydrogenase [Cytophagaceae bacterium]|jgi:shikimate dehydrogenase|nr:shikimate dehydrogenase [Cytophagaceae bacterium]